MPQQIQDRAECIAKLKKLIADIPYAMLATSAEDGSIHSRPMSSRQDDFNGELWFFTSRDTGKVTAIRNDQHVNVAFASPKDMSFVSIAGRAEIIEDKRKAEELWNPAYKAWFPEGLNDPNLALIKVSVDSAEYWDAPSSTLVHMVGFAKAIATGEKYQTGPKEHGRVDIRH